jgi:tRNA(fMet)-specific endonuclease VapC
MPVARLDVQIQQLRMLATDMAWDVIHGESPTVQRRLMDLQPQQLCISSMTRAELSYSRMELGASKWASRIAEFLKIVRTVPWDEAAADRYAELGFGVHQRGDAELGFGVHQRGGDPGDKDVGIAAHSLATGAILVTGRTETFKAIYEGLTLEDWSDQ